MGAGTGAISGEFNADAAYKSSFGFMPNKTKYYDPFMGIDMKSGLDLRPRVHDAVRTGIKATLTTAGGAGTAGYAMVPIYVDPMVVDTTRKWTPLVETIPRVTNNGMYADYNKITAKGGGFTAAENASLTEKDDTKDRASTQIKFLYAVGAVSGPSLAAQPSYVLQGFEPAGGAVGGFQDISANDSLRMEILVKTRSIKELEENLIINGNSTTSGITGDPTGTEFDGIISLMGSTNTVDKNTSDLQLSDINLAVRYAFDDGGRPSLAVASSSAYYDLEILLNAKFGYMTPNTTQIWGRNYITIKTMVGDIPIIPSMFLSNTTGSKAIYFLDMSVVEMRVLQDLTYEDLAKTNDARRFMLKIYETMIIRNTAFCASITEIK